MKIVPLGDLCHIRIGRTPSRSNPDYWGGPIPWATISDLGQSPLTRTHEGITDLAVTELRMRPVQPETLLYSFKLTIGKMAFAATELYTNEAIAALVPRDASVLDTNYLRFALATIDGGAGSSMAVKGRTLNSESLSRLAVPFVPLDQQRGMAAKLSKQLIAIDHAKSACIASALAIGALRDAMLERSLGGRTAREWDRLRFGNLLRSPLRTGVSGPESHSSDVLGLSLAAVRHGQLDLTRTKRVEVDASTNRLVREGCFYIVRGNGRLDLVGRAGLAPYPVSPVVFPDLLIEADIDPTKIESAYLQLVWDTREVRTDLESRARTAAGIHKINLTNLAQVLVPAPDLSQQRRIAAELRERLAAIDATEASIQAEREAIEALPAALLRRAFENLAA